MVVEVLFGRDVLVIVTGVLAPRAQIREQAMGDVGLVDQVVDRRDRQQQPREDQERDLNQPATAGPLALVVAWLQPLGQEPPAPAVDLRRHIGLDCHANLAHIVAHDTGTRRGAI